MSTKLQQWGAVLLAYGIIALVLPAVTGMQLKIFNAFGAQSMKAAVGAVLVGGVMWGIGRAAGSSSPAGEDAPAPAGDAFSPPPPVPSGAALCSGCGAPLQHDQKFCRQCGQHAPVPVPVQAHVQAQPTERPSFCMSCGAALRATGRFCPQCGTQAV